MTRDLANERARFLLDAARVDRVKRLVDPLKDAPLRLRRLGLPVAVATWSREGHDALIRILADWLFEGWGMLEQGTVPQGSVALLDRLVMIDEKAPLLRSAAEVEAEQLLQTAKVLAAALTGESHG
jgi:hypothetical protein